MPEDSKSYPIPVSKNGLNYLYPLNLNTRTLLHLPFYPILFRNFLLQHLVCAHYNTPSASTVPFAPDPERETPLRWQATAVTREYQQASTLYALLNEKKN